MKRTSAEKHSGTTDGKATKSSAAGVTERIAAGEPVNALRALRTGKGGRIYSEPVASAELIYRR